MDENNNMTQNQNEYVYDNQGGYQGGFDDNRAEETNVRPNIKPKRKKRFITKALGFIGAALLFGVIAGAAASGYEFINRLIEKSDNPYKFVRDEDTGEDKGQEDNEGQEDNDGQEENDGQIKEIDSASEKNHIDEPVIGKSVLVSDISDVVNKVMPSIVAINSTSINNYSFFGRQFSEPVEGSGSGFIIAQRKNSILILTNNHVVDNANRIEILFCDGTSAEAGLKGAEPVTDLAVLEVSINDLSEDTLKSIRVASLGDSDALRAGEMVIAIGNAMGYGQSVTMGYVSALGRKIEGVDTSLIQTDAAINPGNSGGALLNMRGEVIGINTVKFADEEVEGMGYSIPISDVIPIINQLVDRRILKESEKGYLGINLETAEEVDVTVSRQFGMPEGIYINDVIEDSPAEKAGLKPGSIITAFNGIKVKTKDDLINVISYAKAGEKVTLKINVMNDNGDYVEEELTVVLAKKKD